MRQCQKVTVISDHAVATVNVAVSVMVKVTVGATVNVAVCRVAAHS